MSGLPVRSPVLARVRHQLTAWRPDGAGLPTTSAPLVIPSPRLPFLDNKIKAMKKNCKRKIAFDPAYPKINESRFKEYGWEGFYRDCKDPMEGRQSSFCGSTRKYTRYSYYLRSSTKCYTKIHTYVFVEPYQEVVLLRNFIRKLTMIGDDNGGAQC